MDTSRTLKAIDKLYKKADNAAKNRDFISQKKFLELAESLKKQLLQSSRYGYYYG